MSAAQARTLIARGERLRAEGAALVAQGAEQLADIEAEAEREAQHSSRTQHLTPEGAGDYLHVAVQTLAHWRSQGVGPVYVKCGARVLYPVDSLDAWLLERRRGSTSEETPTLRAVSR